MKKNPRFDDSFNEHFPYFAQCFPPSYFPTSSSIPSFLNNANVSKIPGQVPHHNEDFTRPNSGDEVSQSPTYLSSLQPDLAVKETFMQNSLSTPNPASNIADNDFATHGAVNHSPELWTEPFPLVDRENVIPLNAMPSNGTAVNGTAVNGTAVTGVTREMAALYGELTHLISGLQADITALHTRLQITQSDVRATQADLQVAHAGLRATQADLQVAHEQIQALKQWNQRSDDDMLSFKQQQQQALRQQAQIHWNQGQQMERRLLQGAEETVKRAFHNERERSIRVGRSAVSEPTRQPSTYSVPKRENKGIYAK
jgi:hypothetical protein